jgi:hypothetical protein
VSWIDARETKSALPPGLSLLLAAAAATGRQGRDVGAFSLVQRSFFQSIPPARFPLEVKKHTYASRGFTEAEHPRRKNTTATSCCWR